MIDTTNLYVSRGADSRIIVVKSIEGRATYGGGLMANPLIMGEHMTSSEITFTNGTGAPVHVYAHESLVYMVRGRIKTTIGEEDLILELGDTFLHPTGMPQTVEALEDSTMVEIKSPAPDITNFFEW